MISTVSKVIVRACVCVLPSSTSPSRLLENGLSKLIQIGSIPKTYNPPNIKSPIIGVKSMWQDVASNKMVFQSSPLPESRASSSNWVCPKIGYTPQFDAKLHQVPHENYTLFIGYPYFQTLPDIMFFCYRVTECAKNFPTRQDVVETLLALAPEPMQLCRAPWCFRCRNHVSALRSSKLQSKRTYGGFLKWFSPKSSMKNKMFHCKPSFLGNPHFGKPPYTDSDRSTMNNWFSNH